MRALIFGVTGQDGSYLSEELLDKGYDVVGVVRRSATPNDMNIKHLFEHRNFKIVSGDITDSGCVRDVVDYIRPTEIYNLACQSHVGISYKVPAYTFQTVANGALNILDAIVKNKHEDTIKFYQASSSEMFGSNIDSDGFQRETTSFAPVSPYAVGKVAAHHLTRVYRESYGIHASCGILFNHESCRRGLQFVTRKVCHYVGQLYTHMKHISYTDFAKLELGNLHACRDWGYAPDYCHAMWLMLQQENPDDYVIATGETRTISELLEVAFKHIGIDDYKPYVSISENLIRPSEVNKLRGDSSKAREVLSWQPNITFKEMIGLMVDAEIKTLDKEPDYSTQKVLEQ